MAKKKTETSDRKSEPTAKKTPQKKASTSAAAGKSSQPASAKSAARSKPAPPKQTPMVDTSLAAQAAAQMLAAGIGRRETQHQNQSEGSLIRQLKADLNKGHAQSVSNVLDKGAPQGQKRTGGGGSPFGQKQVGHNQTFGPDVTRSGVPRRTSG